MATNSSTQNTKPNKIALVLGTRPETIKLAPLAQESLRRGFSAHIWNTGQHRDLVAPLLGAFGLRAHVDLNLMTSGQSPAAFFARAVAALSATIQAERPDWILVQGDTSTAAAAALAGFYEKVPVAHVEAGLRTHDLQSPWPEEYHRRLIAVSADQHFSPTPSAAENLVREGVPPEKIRVTGNTGIDALLWMRQKLRGEAGTPFQEKWAVRLQGKPLVLCTLHRRESFGETMDGLMRAVLTLARSTEAHVLLPLHPNPEVQRAAAVLRANKPENLHLTEPLDYQEFVWLMDRCAFLISDSGGVQEEAPALGKPVIIARDKTERPEAVSAGSNILAGANPDALVSHATRLLSDPAALARMAVPRFPFGDGHAAPAILDSLLEKSPAAHQ